VSEINLRIRDDGSFVVQTYRVGYNDFEFEPTSLDAIERTLDRAKARISTVLSSDYDATREWVVERHGRLVR
jgi:hypothetical protein